MIISPANHTTVAIMHIPRFFLSGKQIARPLPTSTPGTPGATESVTILDTGVVNQIRNVLRLKPEDQVIILDGEGGLLDCRLVRIERREIECLVTGRRDSGRAPWLAVTVALPLLKGDHFDWALQKLTELGVNTIRPIITSRTVVRIQEVGDAKSRQGGAGKLDRWRSIAREAAEQCERATIPQIVEPAIFRDYLSTLTDGGTNSTVYICTERLVEPLLKDSLLSRLRATETEQDSKRENISVIVGPEGGFTSDEITIAIEQGCKPVSLGSRILRTETAAIYALAQIMWCLEKN